MAIHLPSDAVGFHFMLTLSFALLHTQWALCAHANCRFQVYQARRRWLPSSVVDDAHPRHFSISLFKFIHNFSVLLVLQRLDRHVGDTKPQLCNSVYDCVDCIGEFFSDIILRWNDPKHIARELCSEISKPTKQSWLYTFYMDCTSGFDNKDKTCTKTKNFSLLPVSKPHLQTSYIQCTFLPAPLQRRPTNNITSSSSECAAHPCMARRARGYILAPLHLSRLWGMGLPPTTC